MTKKKLFSQNQSTGKKVSKLYVETPGKFFLGHYSCSTLRKLRFKKPKVTDDSLESTFSNSIHFDSVGNARAAVNEL